jgi:hypothetical protein
MLANAAQALVLAALTLVLMPVVALGVMRVWQGIDRISDTIANALDSHGKRGTWVILGLFLGVMSLVVLVAYLLAAQVTQLVWRS